MALTIAHNFAFFFGWNRFNGFGYVGVEKNAERAQ